MGMGYFANNAQITTLDKLKEFMPDEVEQFLNTLEEVGASFDEWCKSVEYDMEVGDLEEEDYKRIEGEWVKFAKSFELKTTIYGNHLKIIPAYREERERYDSEEAVGGFFIIDNVYKMTEPALLFRSLWIDASWCDYG